LPLPAPSRKPPAHRPRPAHRLAAHLRPRAPAARPQARLHGRARGRGSARGLFAPHHRGPGRVLARPRSGMTFVAERFAEIRPLVEMEAQLARAAIAARGRFYEGDEAAIRYALSLARAVYVRAPDGRDVAVSRLLRPLRQHLVQLLWPLLDPQRLRSEEHTSELQSPYDLVCRLLLEKKKAFS